MFIKAAQDTLNLVEPKLKNFLKNLWLEFTTSKSSKRTTTAKVTYINTEESEKSPAKKKIVYGSSLARFEQKKV